MRRTDQVIIRRLSHNVPCAGEDYFQGFVKRRTVNNTMRIKDGGTVTVAGLKKNDAYSTRRDTPGLSKIPLLGALFSNKNKVEISQQVAVFVTARLIPNSVVPAGSGRQTGTATQKTPDIVKRIEANFKRTLEESLLRSNR